MVPRFPATALLILIAPALFAQEYPIHLQRALKPGDDLKISVTGKQSQDTTVTADGAPQPEVKYEITAQLDAVEKVLAVDAKGKETKITLTIDKFVISASDRKPAEVLDKGDVVLCYLVDKKQIYEIAGKPVSPLFGTFLDLVVDLSHGEPSKDEGFGTADKKKKGESWNLDGAAVKKSLESGGGYEFDNIAGKTTLDDAAGGVMKITVHFTGDVKMPVPDTYTLDGASINATYKETLPVDASKYLSDDSEDIIITFTATGQAAAPGQKVVAKATIEKTMTRSITPAD